jgi:hypothetical protein
MLIENRTETLADLIHGRSIPDGDRIGVWISWSALSFARSKAMMTGGEQSGLSP